MGASDKEWHAFVSRKRKSVKRIVKEFRAKRKQSISEMQSKFDGIIDSALLEMNSVLEKTPYHGTYSDDEEEAQTARWRWHHQMIEDDPNNDEENGDSHQSKVLCGHCMRIVRDDFSGCENCPLRACTEHCISTTCGDHYGSEKEYNTGVYCIKCWDEVSSIAYTMCRNLGFTL